MGVGAAAAPRPQPFSLRPLADNLWFPFALAVAPACKVSVLSQENGPYKRADLTSGLYPTIAHFDWDLPKIDLTSGLHCIPRRATISKAEGSGRKWIEMAMF